MELNKRLTTSSDQLNAYIDFYHVSFDKETAKILKYAQSFISNECVCIREDDDLAHTEVMAMNLCNFMQAIEKHMELSSNQIDIESFVEMFEAHMDGEIEDTQAMLIELCRA